MNYKNSSILSLCVLSFLCTFAFSQSIEVYKHPKFLQSTKVFPKSDTVIIHLGGNWNRIDKTIELAAAIPEAVVVVSSEGNLATVIDRLD